MFAAKFCLLISPLVTIVNAGICADTSPINLKVDQGTYSGRQCENIDGAKHLYWNSSFHSVNNDKYHLEAHVYQDTAGSPAATPFCHTSSGINYDDSFDHDESYNINNCQGTYVTVMIQLRYYCDKPGSGSQCQIVVSQENFGNYGSLDHANATKAK